MITYSLKILEIHQETADTVTICFKQPSLKKVKYKAGQYLTLKFNINNRKYSRAYSFSSAPSIESTLNVTVKRVPGGVVSNHIADCLNVGDIVEAIEPLGDFTLENHGINADNQIVLWAAGSGVTPIFSIAKFALQNNLVKHVTLVYGNRDLERTIFTKQILELQKQYSSNFSVWNFHTVPFIDTSNLSIIQGRIDPEKVLKVLSNEIDYALNQTFHYICGPVGLKESVKQVLALNSVPAENIFAEEFKLIVDPKKFEGVTTQKVVIKTASATHEVEVAKGKTILEAGLDAMIDLPYSCQIGSCLLCKGTLEIGQIRSLMDEHNLVEMQDKDCLLCSSIPITGDVVISIN